MIIESTLRIIAISISSDKTLFTDFKDYQDQEQLIKNGLFNAYTKVRTAFKDCIIGLLKLEESHAYFQGIMLSLFDDVS